MATADGAGLRFLYRLASHLGRPVVEVMALSLAEIEGWVAYLSLEKDSTDGAARPDFSDHRPR